MTKESQLPRSPRARPEAAWARRVPHCRGDPGGHQPPHRKRRSATGDFGEPEHYAAALVAADQPESDPEQSYEARTFRATATDEVEILTNLGRDGWELTGVRDFGFTPVAP